MNICVYYNAHYWTIRIYTYETWNIYFTKIIWKTVDPVAIFVDMHVFNVWNIFTEFLSLRPFSKRSSNDRDE